LEKPKLANTNNMTQQQQHQQQPPHWITVAIVAAYCCLTGESIQRIAQQAIKAPECKAHFKSLLDGREIKMLNFVNGKSQPASKQEKLLPLIDSSIHGCAFLDYF